MVTLTAMVWQFAKKDGEDLFVMKKLVNWIATKEDFVRMEFVFVKMDLLEKLVNFLNAPMDAAETVFAKKTEPVHVNKTSRG